MKWSISILAICAIFALSIVGRKDYIQPTVSKENDGHMVMLTTLENWHKQGATRYLFSPIQTWPNSADKFIAFYPRLTDTKGDNYFVSFPHLSFIVAHLFFEISHTPPSTIGLHYLALCLHLLAAILLWGLTNRLIHKRTWEMSLEALTAFITLTFFPPLLFHGLYFFPELMALPLWIGFLLLLTRYQEHGTNRWLIMGIAFLLMQTEWIGYLIVLVCILVSHKKTALYPLRNPLLLTGLFSITVTVFWYSQLNGLTHYLEAVGIRFVERSGFFGSLYTDQHLSFWELDTYRHFVKHAHLSLLGFGYLLALLSLYLWLKKKKRFPLGTKRTLLLLGIPPLAYLFILFNSHVIHFGSWAKFGPFIGLSLGLFLAQWDNTSYLKKPIVGILLSIAMVVSMVQFYSFMPSEKTNTNTLQLVSNIAYSASPKDVILIDTRLIPTYDINYVSYITKRNMQFAGSLLEAKKILTLSPYKQANFYTFDQHKQTIIVQKILLP